jgi:hypothetical protein
MGHSSTSFGLRAVLVAALAVLLVAGATGCGLQPSDGGSPGPRQAAVERALAAAADAVLVQSPWAWDAALPARSRQARRAWREVYHGLVRYPFRTLSFSAKLIPGTSDKYMVDARGSFDGVTSYKVAERELHLAWTEGRARLVDDCTPRKYRRLYFLAFLHPGVVQSGHLTVIGDRSLRALIDEVVDRDGLLRKVAVSLGADPRRVLRRRTLVAVCAAARQAEAASSTHDDQDAAAFATSSGVYVIADSIWNGQVGNVMRHEYAHVVRPGFSSRRYQPSILVEGIAVEVEGPQDFTSLKRDVGLGNRLLRLRHALTLDDLFVHLSGGQTDLAYLEGAALVRFIRQVWGEDKLREYGRALASDDPITVAGVTSATQRVFGEDWTRFFGEWRRFVSTL